MEISPMLFKPKKNQYGEKIVLMIVNGYVVYELEESSVDNNLTGLQIFTDGHIPGVKKVYDNGDFAYEFCDVVQISGTSYLDRVMQHAWHGVKFSVEDNAWSYYVIPSYLRGNIAVVDDNSFVEKATGAEVDYATAHEDDLTQPILGEDGITVIGYKQKLKETHDTMVEFYLDNLYKTNIFPALIQTHIYKSGYIV